MSRVLKVIIAANLLVLAVLLFIYPQLMVAPGKLTAGHHTLEADCFACHAPFSGAQAARCIECHKPQEIGRLFTTGKPVVKPATTTPFHQSLSKNDCIACHSDHAGARRFRETGRFEHGLLKVATREQCQECHRGPDDSLHRQISGNCKKCHETTRWTPASFEHDNYFLLDRDHNVQCVTCHTRNDYSRYTCYGCHEHTVSNIRREHMEEGIRDFQNCVKCHRSADEPQEWEGRRERWRGGDDD